MYDKLPPFSHAHLISHTQNYFYTQFISFQLNRTPWFKTIPSAHLISHTRHFRESDFLKFHTVLISTHRSSHFTHHQSQPPNFWNFDRRVRVGVWAPSRSCIQNHIADVIIGSYKQGVVGSGVITLCWIYPKQQKVFRSVFLFVRIC